MVGGIATSVHYLVLFVLTKVFDVQPTVSTTIGSVCGALIAYIGNKHFTFPKNLISTAHNLTLGRFLFVAGIGTFLSASLVWISTNFFAWHYFVGQITATLLSLILTYQLNRLWTFR